MYYSLFLKNVFQVISRCSPNGHSMGLTCTPDAGSLSHPAESTRDPRPLYLSVHVVPSVVSFLVYPQSLPFYLGIYFQCLNIAQIPPVLKIKQTHLNMTNTGQIAPHIICPISLAEGDASGCPHTCVLRSLNVQDAAGRGKGWEGSVWALAQKGRAGTVRSAHDTRKWGRHSASTPATTPACRGWS